MNVVVTGGTGFLGRHVVWRLAALGHDVAFTGRDVDRASTVGALARAGSTVRFVRGGAAIVDGVDAVIHCAARSAPWGRRDAFERDNVDLTRDVVAACEAHRVARLVHVSTTSLYFDFTDRLDIREDAPLPPPVNAYAATKRMAETIVAASTIAHAIVLRPRAIFGPWDATLLPRLLRVARRTRLPLLRGGGALIDLTYVDNVVDAVLLALASPLARATFHVSNGEPVRVADLFGVLATAFGFEAHFRRVPYPLAAAAATAMEAVGRVLPRWEPPLTRYSVGLLAFSQTLDLSAARERLHYAPSVSMDEGIRRTAAWFDGEGARCR